MELNEIISLQLRHRSIRRFAGDPVPRAHLDAIVSAAQHASTSSNMQAYSVIRITDPALRVRMAEAAGHQQYVVDCPEFLVWCADLHRLWHMGAWEGEPAKEANSEWFLVSAIDAALAAQNAALAAESLGYGIVYIGGIRNDLARTTALLRLPKRVVPLFGMCIGVPDQEPLPRPRLAAEAMMHENGYDTDELDRWIAEYDARLSAYMMARSGGQSGAGWSEQMGAKVRQPGRRHGRFLKEHGFDLLD